MAMEIYTFDKSLQERLTEYNTILKVQSRTVSASDISSEWAYYIELAIEPTGWQALWKIPRLLCEDFGIRYPTIVFVEAESVDFSELFAIVRIIAVQEDIHLPDTYEVPLIELYLTLNQKHTALDLLGTANCIDQLRFFYNYLWMPWDVNDDDHIDWLNNHLEIRLRLFFDMKRGIVNKETCDIIRSLIREAKEIEKKITHLEASISDEEEPHEGIADETCQLMKLHLRIQHIKTEMEVLENPVIREMLAKNHSLSLNTEKKRNSKDGKNICYFVWLGGTVQELQEASNKIQTLLSEDLPIKVRGCLEEALHASETGDIILLGEGNHPIKGVYGLEEGGTIKGINNTERTVLCLKKLESGPALLDFSGDKVLLENICIDLKEVQVGIIVRKGNVHIIACKICVSSQSTVKLGVVVLPGAKLTIEKTLFDGLGTAVVTYATGEAVINDCCFKNCVEGIQFNDNTHITVARCSFENSKEYGIRMETHKYLSGSESKSGDSELLNSIPEISINACKFVNSIKADIVLKPKNIAALLEHQDPECVISVTK